MGTLETVVGGSGRVGAAAASRSQRSREEVMGWPSGESSGNAGSPEAVGVGQRRDDVGPADRVGAVDGPPQRGEGAVERGPLDPRGDGVAGRLGAEVVVEAKELYAAGGQQGEGLLRGAGDGVEARRHVA